MTLLAIFEALVGANAIWETTVQYVAFQKLRGEDFCGKSTIATEMKCFGIERGRGRGGGKISMKMCVK